MSVFLYAVGFWILNAATESGIRAIEMRGHRRLFCISNKEHVTSVEVREIIENAIEPHVDFLTTFLQRKLRWYGHTSCTSGFTKTIMRSAVNGCRRNVPSLD